MENVNIVWDDVIKKEARGVNDDDLGEVLVSELIL